MPRVLVFPYSNQLGTTIPSLTLAKLLQSRGYEIVFASAGRYTHVVNDRGFIVKPINEISFAQYREHVNQNNFDYFAEPLVQHFIDVERDLIAQVKPDLLVHHNRQTVHLTSRIEKLPLISFTVAALTPYYDYRYFIPENHILDRVNQRLPRIDLDDYMPNWLARTLINQAAKSWNKSFNAVERRYGLTETNTFLDLSLGDITLLMETFGLAAVKNAPRNYFYLEQDIDSNYGNEHAWIENLKRDRRDGKAVIFVSMGSSAQESYPLVVKNLAEFVADNADRFSLISNNCGLESEYRACPNIHIEKFIHSPSVLPHVDVVVTHGGKNTLNECILSGKLIVGVPEQAEQLWNLKFVESLGIGAVVTRTELRHDRRALPTKILELIETPRHQQRLDSFLVDLRKRRSALDLKTPLLDAVDALIQ